MAIREGALEEKSQEKNVMALPEKRKYMNIVTLSFAGNCHGFPLSDR